MKWKSFSIVKSIKFHSFDVKAIITKKSRTAFCEKLVRRKEILLWLWWKRIKFFKIDSYYPKTLAATFLNYMNQRMEEKESYDITSQI